MTTTIGFGAASSVTSSIPLATYNYNANHVAKETVAGAVNLGDLVESNTNVAISGDSSSDATSSYNVTVQQGNNLQLGLQNIDTLYTHVQIVDNSGNVIADSSGNAYQVQQYNQVVSASGLNVAAGDYTVNLLNTAGSSADQTASFNTVNTSGTSLTANSQLTQVDPAEYYKFNLTEGNNLKLAFQNTTGTSTARVQLYDSTGTKLIADSQGNSLQQQAFTNLTSSTGLTESAGTYVVKVSYANGADTSQNQSYNLQLFSGSNYASSYVTTAKAVTTATATDSVTPDSQAQVYGRSAYNTINETASSAVNVGWLQENKSSLNVISQLTPVDSSEYYTFTLQQGNNLKLAFTNQTNTSGLRVQVYDSTGSRIIADSQGTVAQQAAYQALTSYNGVTENPGSYVVKVSYASTSNQKAQTYNFQVYSGTTFTSSYKTIASAQTLQNALLSGESVGGATSYSAVSSLASYLTSAQSTTPVSVFATTSV